MGIEIYQLMVGYNDDLIHRGRKETEQSEPQKKGYLVDLSEDSLSFMDVTDDRSDLFEVFNTAFACGMKVFYTNGILSNTQVVNRAISYLSGIPMEKIKSGDLTKEEWSTLDEKIRQLYGWPLYIASNQVRQDDDLRVARCLGEFEKVYDEKDRWLLVIDCDADFTALGIAWGRLKRLHCPIVIANVGDEK